MCKILWNSSPNYLSHDQSDNGNSFIDEYLKVHNKDMFSKDDYILGQLGQPCEQKLWLIL